jgi:galactoside O-acetyltransferase
MAYLSYEIMQGMNFRRLGKNVKISDKASIYNADQIEIGDHSRIDDFSVLSGRVVLGRNVHIAVLCSVSGGSEGVTMEDFSGLAYGCHVFSQSDDYTGLTLTNPTVPSEFKMEKKSKVVIGRHCIIGAHSVVFPGVTMSEGCSLGAMSMLTKSTDPWSIYFGIPAKKIKERKKNLLILEKAYLDSEKY